MAWEQLDVPATRTALGVREKATPANHTTVAADSRAPSTHACHRENASPQI
jgi:hypothetical protein